MNRLQRVSVVGGASEFRAETPARGFQGANEMSFVALVWMTDVSFSAAGEPLVVLAGAGNTGYTFQAGGGANSFFATIGTGAGFAVPTSRLFAARDVDKAHRIVLVSSVAALTARIYTNGLNDGTPAALAAYSAPSPPTGYEILSNPLTTGLQSMELLDFAVINRALTAADVARLDRQIVAYGRIPSSFMPWVDLYRPERLVGHSKVWDRGGLNAGNGLVCRVGPATSTLGAPTLNSRLITAWGGF